jgi:glycosyltransferase involved in cell wall biosynthesis
MTAGRPKVALLTNIVAPYRVPVYDVLGERFEMLILYSGSESNRATWGGTVDSLRNCTAKHSWGFAIRRRVRSNGRDWDVNTKHINPGYWADLRRFRPDAVISNELGFRTALAVLYGRLKRKPVWVWWGGTLHTERNLSAWRTRMRVRMAARVPRWISYGETSTEYLSTLGVRREDVLQIQNCVDERLFSQEYPPALGIDPKPVILHVGQLIARKGLVELLQAAGRVQADGKEFSLAFVGHGPDEGALKELAHSLGLRNVRFEGGRRPAEMPAVYRSADCLVFPTLEDVWGLVANEALWCGIPVLGSKYAGCAKEILPPEAVFDPLDPDDFAHKLSLAVAGALPPADTSRLRGYRDVGESIATDVEARLGVTPSPSAVTGSANP